MSLSSASSSVVVVIISHFVSYCPRCQSPRLSLSLSSVSSSVVVLSSIFSSVVVSSSVSSSVVVLVVSHLVSRCPCLQSPRQLLSLLSVSSSIVVLVVSLLVSYCPCHQSPCQSWSLSSVSSSVIVFVVSPIVSRCPCRQLSASSSVVFLVVSLLVLVVSLFVIRFPCYQLFLQSLSLLSASRQSLSFSLASSSLIFLLVLLFVRRCPFAVCLLLDGLYLFLCLGCCCVMDVTAQSVFVLQVFSGYKIRNADFLWWSLWRLKSLLLSCDDFRTLINSLVC